MSAHPDPSLPSPWVCRWAPLITPGGPVLDLACGSGRHALYLARMGFSVDAVDRDAEALSPIRSQNIATRQADLEGGGWPYPGRAFAAVVVCNYLWRALFPILLESLAPDGVMIYETFAAGNERYGRPSNPDFLLRPGELLDVVRGRLRVVAYEEGYVERPRPAIIQRICAVNGSGPRPVLP